MSHTNEETRKIKEWFPIADTDDVLSRQAPMAITIYEVEKNNNSEAEVQICNWTLMGHDPPIIKNEGIRLTHWEFNFLISKVPSSWRAGLNSIHSPIMERNITITFNRETEKYGFKIGNDTIDIS